MGGDLTDAPNGKSPSFLVAALKDALARSAEDESVRVVAITGAGKDFCSGADLKDVEIRLGEWPVLFPASRLRRCDDLIGETRMDAERGRHMK